MALIDELKRRHNTLRQEMNELVAQEEVIGNQLLDLDIAIAALEAPAPPLDELRSVPGAEEESRDQSDDWTPTVQPADLTVADLDKLATKASPEERAEYDDPTAVAIAAYIKAENEAPAPEQDASGERDDMQDSCAYCGMALHLDDADTCMTDDGWQCPKCTASAREHIRLTAVAAEPSPYAEAIEKGAITQDEADFLISERERIAAAEQAKFFAEGMMADADRHAQDQRGIVEKIGGVLGFKREREDA